MTRVFLSHATADNALLPVVLQRLSGVIEDPQFYVAERDIPVGEEWKSSFLSHLRKSDVFALLWTRNTRTSSWVAVEIIEAIHEKHARPDLRIIPILDGSEALLPELQKYQALRIHTFVRDLEGVVSYAIIAISYGLLTFLWAAFFGFGLVFRCLALLLGLSLVGLWIRRMRRVRPSAAGRQLQAHIAALNVPAEPPSPLHEGPPVPPGPR